MHYPHPEPDTEMPVLLTPGSLVVNTAPMIAACFPDSRGRRVEHTADVLVTSVDQRGAQRAVRSRVDRSIDVLGHHLVFVDEDEHVD